MDSLHGFFTTSKRAWQCKTSAIGERKNAVKSSVSPSRIAHARRELETGHYEAVLEDAQIPTRLRVADLHIGGNKPRHDRSARSDALGESS
jgi:hypothetical protein